MDQFSTGGVDQFQSGGSNAPCSTTRGGRRRVLVSPCCGEKFTSSSGWRSRRNVSQSKSVFATKPRTRQGVDAVRAAQVRSKCLRSPLRSDAQFCPHCHLHGPALESVCKRHANAVASLPPHLHSPFSALTPPAAHVHELLQCPRDEGPRLTLLSRCNPFIRDSLGDPARPLCQFTRRSTPTRAPHVREP